MNDKNSIIKTMKISSTNGNFISAVSAKIIREVTLKILLHGKPMATIACAGNNLDELAIGFLRSEKIIGSRDEIAKIEIDNNEPSVNILLKKEKEFSSLFVKNIASSGAHGQANIESLLPLDVPDDFNIKASVASKLMKDLLDSSAIHSETRGTHCSALAHKDKIFVLREDIGRHNTIDMLSGYCLLQNINFFNTIILTTGRISSEIVYKIWNMGVPIIISHSAPTTRAVELLQKANITLIGYVRGNKMNIYSQERRVVI